MFVVCPNIYSVAHQSLFICALKRCGMAWHDKSSCCTYEHINESTVWWRRHLPSTLRGQENWSNGQRICMSATEIKHKMVNNKQITPQYILKFSKRFTHNVKCENLYHFRYLMFGCVHAKHFLCCVHVHVSLLKITIYCFGRWTGGRWLPNCKSAMYFNIRHFSGGSFACDKMVKRCGVVSWSFYSV